jgi:hypothetical protein
MSLGLREVSLEIWQSRRLDRFGLDVDFLDDFGRFSTNPCGAIRFFSILPREDQLKIGSKEPKN